MNGRVRFRPRAARVARGAAYDVDAQAYIDATGELFPEALNTLVVGIKAAGLWDDHIGSIKKAIGVPSLAASMIDLRNTAFNGTAVNTPTHSATAGWTLARTSSQYIAQVWRPGATDSKGTLNSSHFGLRVRASQPVAQGAVCANSYSNPNYFGFGYLENGFQQFGANDSMAGNTYNANPAAPASYIISRTASNVVKLLRNGVVVTNSATASGSLNGLAPFLASRNLGGSPSEFTDCRYSLVHGGAGLDDAQAAALTTLFDAYATVAGET